MHRFHYFIRVFTLLLCLAYLPATAQQYYLFVGSYNKTKGQEGIYVYTFNPSTGATKKISAVTEVVNPSYLNLSARGQFLYAATESRIPGGGTVSSYAFDSLHGTLRFLNCQSSGGENPVYVITDSANKWLANANYTAGSLSIHPLLPDGSIGLPEQTIQITAKSVGPRQNQSHVHSVGFSPDEKYLYAPDLGADKIWWYQLASGEKPLQSAPVPFTVTMPNSGPRHFAFHPNGKFGYCMEEISGNVVAYRYRNGRLDSMQTIAAHFIKDEEGYDGADIHLSPDGRYLYTSTRGNENIIVCYAIDARSGRLTKRSITPSGGNHPRNFVIDPTGNYLLVAHQMSDDIVIFKRNAKSGALQQTGKLEHITAPSCLKIRAYNVQP
ncbi:MAG: lactonase family protein [Chitinophaga sp.]|uniref:lactonase family protein n=1 Tax=Chitinophaga sp. TaxID=1869181 RepID=UPI0025BD0333|nr:lactonase family protein [Chitinophaga sp.]MBV8253078.1 lactonase family protein [Chitinophaga sp.]